MRSLAIFHLGGVGGPSRSLVGAMSWLAERGTVEVLVPESGATERAYRGIGRVTVADYSALTYARGLRARVVAMRDLARDVTFFRRELRRRRPELVVVVTTVLPAALIAARLERIPRVVYAAELYDKPRKGAPRLHLWGAGLATATALLGDGIVCCSRAVAAQFPRRPSRPLTVAYPPIGEHYANADRAAARARFGLSDDELCLAVVGDLSRGRGQDVAIRVLALLRERYASIRLLVVGAPHPRPLDLAFADELRALARELRVDDAVVFVEPTDAVADVYAAANVILNPLRYAEAFGRVGPEALVAGRPVVASRVGAIHEAVREGVDALLVEPEDATGFAEAVTRLVEDPRLADGLVASGRRRVLAEFDEEQDLAAWRDVVTAVMSGRQLPRADATGPADEHADRPGERRQQQPS